MRRLAAVVLGLVLAAAARAGPPVATRADLARSFLRFQEVYRKHPPDPARRAAVNAAFDRATLAFFRGGFGEVSRDLDALADSLLPGGETSPSGRLARSLRVLFEPRIAEAGRTPSAGARISTVYDVERPAAPVRLVLRLARRDGLVFETAIVVPPGAVDLRVPVPRAVLEQPGTWRISLDPPDGEPVAAGSWSVAPRPLAGIRAAFAARLDRVATDSAALADAAAAVRDRLTLLDEEDDLDRTIVLLTDPLSLAAEIETDLAALEAGRDPLRRRPGHLWRTLRVGRLAIPMRLYAPEAAREGKPLPVVVALHGAGGDECFFPEAYGAGEIVRLADERGFVVVSPVTTAFAVSPRALDVLLETLSLHTPVDRDRVYLLGHSLGAMTATVLAQRWAGDLAAASAIAGGGSIAAGRAMAPTLFVAGERDPIVPASSVRAAFEAARAAGYPVAFRPEEGYGHTLIVGDLLPDVVEWLLRHRRGDGAGAERRR